MKKYIAMILSIFLLTTSLPTTLFAAANTSDEIVLEAQGSILTVKLKLANAAGEKLSSVQLSLQADGGTFSDFTFDTQVTGRAKVWEAYAGEENRMLNLYIAGTAPLYQEGIDTLTIGRVVLQSTNTSVTVEAKDVKVVRGTEVEDKDLSELIQISLGTNQNNNSGAYDPIAPGPGQISTGTNHPSQPQEPAEPQKPSTDQPQPQEPSEDAAAIEEPRLNKLVNATAGVTVKWFKSDHADGYYVYRKVPGGRYKRIAAVKGKNITSYTDRAVKTKNGKTYLYTVRAYKGKEVSAYNKAGLRIYRLVTPTLLKLSSKSAKTMTVKWKKNGKCNGYQVQYAYTSDFKTGRVVKKVKSKAKTILTVKKLKKKKNCYVRIRSYRKIGETIYYSAWTKAKKVKIRA